MAKPKRNPYQDPTSLRALNDSSLVAHARPSRSPSGRLMTVRLSKPQPTTVPTALTAAAVPIAPRVRRNGEDRDTRRNSARAWQEEVLAAAGQIGELRYIANTTANSASRAWVYPEDPSAPPAPPSTLATQPPPDNLVDAELVRRMALMIVLIGETYLVDLPTNLVPGAMPSSETPSSQGKRGVTTLALSPMDVRHNGSVVHVGPYGEFPVGSVRITRVYRPDVRNIDLPDSPARSLLPTLREIIGLNMHVSATIDSRLAGAGVFCYPIEAEVTPAPGTNLSSDATFGEAFVEAVITPISDRDSASAVAPVMLGLPEGHTKESVGWLTQPQSGLDANLSALREDDAVRIARGMDAPPEVVLGAKGMGQYTAWSVEADFIRLQIAPLLRIITDGLMVHFGRKFLFDTTPLTARPNLAQEAQALYDRGAIGDSALRRASGFSEADAPMFGRTGEEESMPPELEMALTLARNSPSLLQTPGLPAVVDQCRVVLGMEPKYADYYGKAVTASPADGGAEPGNPNIPNRDEPRQAPPAPEPRVRKRADGSPDIDHNGKPKPVPGLN